MKNIARFLLLAACVLQLSSCLTLAVGADGRDLPPGQEKKITGDKDASKLAPGKNK